MFFSLDVKNKQRTLTFINKLGFIRENIEEIPGIVSDKGENNVRNPTQKRRKYETECRE